MKRFILHLSILGMILLISSELIIRILNLSRPPLNKIKNEGFTLFAPYQSGEMVFGNFGDIRAKFNINQQGYNSVHDYDELFVGQKYAIVGDSFIEGWHEDVNSSIGRRVENMLPQTRVHEYGRSGWNAHNYLQLCNKVGNKYDQIFVICAVSDFLEERANHHIINSGILKKIVVKSRLFCYLYYNKKYASIFKSKQPESADVVVRKEWPDNQISLLQKKFPDNVVWIWRDTEASLLLSDTIITIKHDLKPYNYGLLDGHWNSNGRQNAAKTIVALIKAAD